MRSPWLFGLLALPPIPVLFFSAHVPAWAPTAAMIWLAALLIVRSAVTGRWLSHTPADLILLGLLALLPLGLWAAPERDITLPRTYAFIANIAIFYALAMQAENAALRWTGWLLLLAGVAFTIAIVPGTRFYAEQKLPFIAKSMYEILPSGLRLPGDENGFNPNMAGGLLALFLPPALALSIRPHHWTQRILAIVALILLAAAVMLTQSRGAILALLVAIVVVTGVLINPLRWLWWMGGWIALGVAALKGGAILDAFLNADPSGNSVYSMAQRTDLWSRAIYAGLDFPFTGIGLGSFPRVMNLLYPSFKVNITADVPHAHNIYLQALAEMGYPGLVLYLAFFFILLFSLSRQIRQAQDWARSLAVGLLGSLTVLLVHGIVDTPTYSPLSAIVIWGLFGLMMAVGMYTQPLIPDS